ncbi:MAG: hypothetical protein OEY38_17450 [Gammaproteobacteria bacterium]|nr:hypothetical protein [Gammaproteobacteria bacterium]
MNYKYTLSDKWIQITKKLSEFRNGGMQVTIRTLNGEVFEQILISNSKHIVAMKNNCDLPFSLKDIDAIYQTKNDINPIEKGKWDYWDDWS